MRGREDIVKGRESFEVGRGGDATLRVEGSDTTRADWSELEDELYHEKSRTIVNRERN